MEIELHLLVRNVFVILPESGWVEGCIYHKYTSDITSCIADIHTTCT